MKQHSRSSRCLLLLTNLVLLAGACAGELGGQASEVTGTQVVPSNGAASTDPAVVRSATVSTTAITERETAEVTMDTKAGAANAEDDTVARDNSILGDGYRAISAALGNVCALRVNGALVCSDLDGATLTGIPEGEFTAVTSGGHHSCALRTDGELVCWSTHSDADFVDIIAEVPEGRYKAVSANTLSTCGLLADGSAVCWGIDEWAYSHGHVQGGLWSDIPDGRYSSIATGMRHACALDGDGAAVCWDGNGTDQSRDVPSGSFAAITAGMDYSCGLRVDGQIVCWGEYFLGGEYVDEGEEVWYDFGGADTPDGKFTAISAAQNYVCAVRTDGKVVCWGPGSPILPYISNEKKFIAVSAAISGLCAIRLDRQAVCWGYDSAHNITAALQRSYGGSPLAELGEESSNMTDTTATSGTGTYADIAVGTAHLCVLHTNATVVCWGDDQYGQTVVPEGQYEAISAGRDFACGLRTNATVVCWGDDQYGHTVVPEGQYEAISAGWFHSCGLRTDHAVVCWGDNRWSQSDAPKDRLTAISAADYYSCGLRTDGSLVCWGLYVWGSAGEPQGVFVAISSGESYSCGLRKDGTVACWGDYGWSGVAPDGVFTAISSGDTFACGLRTDGNVVCGARSNTWSVEDVPG